MNLTTFLLEPRLRGTDLQGYERIALHDEILANKPLIRNVFEEFYETSLVLDKQCFKEVAGDKIELGAGTSRFKERCPEIISTDVQPAPHLDGVIDAEAMPLKDESVRVFFGINCFHHFPHPDRFFKELIRTLKPGGGCVLIEPYFGFLAARLYKHLFTSEAYDRSAAAWTYQRKPGAEEACPNQALSYLVFFRDRSNFESLFPELEIVHTNVMRNYLRYLLSGGLNFRQLVPTWTEAILRTIEKLLSPLAFVLGLHHVIVLRKRKNLQ